MYGMCKQNKIQIFQKIKCSRISEVCMELPFKIKILFAEQFGPAETLGYNEVALL
jgi:hypothetical protein